MILSLILWLFDIGSKIESGVVGSNEGGGSSSKFSGLYTRFRISRCLFPSTPRFNVPYCAFAALTLVDWSL